MIIFGHYLDRRLVEGKVISDRHYRHGAGVLEKLTSLGVDELAEYPSSCKSAGAHERTFIHWYLS